MKKKLAALLALCLTLSTTVFSVGAALSVEDARTLLDTYYVDKIPREILEQSTLKEILEDLGDPYTQYMTAEDMKNMLDQVNGEKLVGIGVSVGGEDQEAGVLIMSVLPHSPAEEAGLQAGDRVMAVDGVAVDTKDEVRNRIAGPEGDPVEVEILRAEDGSRRSYTMVRREVQVPTASYRMVGNAGYIDCLSFGDTTDATMLEALTKLGEDARLWMLDLRSNPGGTAGSVAACTGLFTTRKPTVYFRDKLQNNMGISVYGTKVSSGGKPLVILTSPYTASAAEIFTVAARDHGFGVSLGQRTFGKAVGQQVFNKETHPEMFDGDNLKITTFRLFGPAGTTYQGAGIIPTILVSEENTTAVGELLSAGTPASALGFVKLELAGQTLFIDKQMARSPDHRAAMTELLEALPPSAQLAVGRSYDYWEPITPAKLAKELYLSCEFRTFSDLEDSPYRREIDTLAVYGLVGGVGDGTFCPDELLTRAQVCAMLANALALPAPKDAPAFADVSKDAWYAKAVSAVVSAGLASGCGDGTFRPDDTITYEQLVVLLSAAAARVNIQTNELNQRGVYASELGTCIDFAPWAQKAARNLAYLDAKLEDTTPTDQLSREKAAALLCRVMESIDLIWPDGQ